jgi:uncharacterized metal-binding protein
MTSGVNHDRLIIITTPIVGAATWCIDPSNVLPVTIAYFAGGWWLSPDLDLASKPFHRWGALRLLWKPYQSLFKHRGSSHWLFVGTLGRVLYLVAPLLLSGMAIDPSFTPKMFDFVAMHGRSLLLVFVALELSAWIHLAADGLLFGGKSK